MSQAPTTSVSNRLAPFLAILPGLLLCMAFGAIAQLLGRVEEMTLGRAWLEPLVLAILLGALARNLVGATPRLNPGIRFSAKLLLDIAVALLGASLSIEALQSLGAWTFLMIATLVLLALGGAFLFGRLLGLGRRVAMLIAVGNSICGNSAIAAVAPVIGATEEEIAAAISLTALTGVLLVLILPAAVYVFGMPVHHYALLAGLTVYAVPQVIAAAAPFGVGVVTLATFVKLARVLMLGPVTLILSLFATRFGPDATKAASARTSPRLLVPWFIIAFLLLALVRWVGLLSPFWIGQFGFAANFFAVIAMAALGFGVRLASLVEVGPRVALTTIFATLLMLALAIALIELA